MLTLRTLLHGIVVVASWSFAILGPGYLGAVIEESRRLIPSPSLPWASDSTWAPYIGFAVCGLCMVGAWQLCAWSNRWRLGR